MVDYNIYCKKNSILNKIRGERLKHFFNLVKKIPKPVSIIDIGGNSQFWRVHASDKKNLRITLLNLQNEQAGKFGYQLIKGDARRTELAAKSFDIVFSNSTIEHLGTISDCDNMAKEVMRIGRRYYVQTPNKYFFIEPHFIFPFFQFLPLCVKIFLLTHFNMGFYKRMEKEEAVKTLKSIMLLSEKDLRNLFPGCKIYKEKFFLMTKSLIAYNGFN